MRRLWLALALVIAIAAPAVATTPHVPSPPTITNAYLEIGDQRTSAGLYDVELLQLAGTFDRYTSIVRIRVHTASGDEVVETTPDQLALVRPKLLVPVGPVTLEITSSDGRLDSEPTRVPVVPQRHHARSGCGEVFGFVMLFGAAMGLLLMFGVLFKLRATEVERTRIRRDTEPTGLPNAAAEEYIRIVAVRALLALVVVTAIVVISIGIELLFVPIFGGPVLLIVVVTAIMRVIHAGRAIALLHRAGAAACTRHDQLEVFAADRHVTLRSSPRLVERARRDALPRATL